MQVRIFHADQVHVLIFSHSPATRDVVCDTHLLYVLNFQSLPAARAVICTNRAWAATLVASTLILNWASFGPAKHDALADRLEVNHETLAVAVTVNSLAGIS